MGCLFSPSKEYGLLTGHEAYANVKSDFRDTKCTLLALRFSDCLEQIIHNVWKPREQYGKQIGCAPTAWCQFGSHFRGWHHLLKELELQISLAWKEDNSTQLQAGPIVACLGFMAQGVIKYLWFGGRWIYLQITGISLASSVFCTRLLVLTQSLKHSYREDRQDTADTQKDTESLLPGKCFLKSQI